MAGEAPSAASLVSELPDWLKWGANIALILFAMVAGPLVARAGRKSERERDSEPFDAEAFLDASPVRKLIAAAEVVADSVPLQTEALKTIAAAASAMARTVEQDWDERRIEREVKRRLQEAGAQREASAR